MRMTALEQLYSDYYKDIYRYLYSLCRDAELAEDLVSETFLAVVKSINTFREECGVKTWLFGIARNKWLEYLHKKKRTPETQTIDEFIEQKPSAAPSSEETFLRRELIKRVYELLDEETERSRKTALMRIEGYSFYEIGKAVGISENSARVTFFRTKEKVRKILKEEGFDYE